MGLACDVYTKLLFHRGYGYPLWEPEPTKAGEVLIGDVGYVLQGSFYRLFNATLPAGHAIHQQWGVPEEFEPFRYPDALLHRRAHALQSGPICSTSVVSKSVEVSAGVSLGNPGGVLELRFKCSGEQGAVLVLREDGAREALHPSKDLIRYIVRNHGSWLRFAQDVFRLDIGESDILFVSGNIKTGAWALAAATHRARDGELVFGGTFGALGDATFSVAASEKVTMSVEHRCGPKPLRDDVGDQRDQCVFLHYYKVKRRPVLGPKVIRGASGEPNPGGRPSSPDESVGQAICELPSGPLDSGFGLTKFRDPVDSILDYILDHTDAHCAVASDQDVKPITQLDPYHTSDDLYHTLVKTQPTLELINHGSIGMLQATDPYEPFISENGLSCDARAIEDNVRQTCAEFIVECVVVGNGRPSPALFVEATPGLAMDDAKPRREIIRRTRPFHARRYLHERIVQVKMVVVVARGTLPRTAATGTVCRRAVEVMFEAELDAMFSRA